MPGSIKELYAVGVAVEDWSEVEPITATTPEELAEKVRRLSKTHIVKHVTPVYRALSPIKWLAEYGELPLAQ